MKDGETKSIVTLKSASVLKVAATGIRALIFKRYRYQCCHRFINSWCNACKTQNRKCITLVELMNLGVCTHLTSIISLNLPVSPKSWFCNTPWSQVTQLTCALDSWTYSPSTIGLLYLTQSNCSKPFTSAGLRLPWIRITSCRAAPRCGPLRRRAWRSPRRQSFGDHGATEPD